MSGWRAVGGSLVGLWVLHCRISVSVLFWLGVCGILILGFCFLRNFLLKMSGTSGLRDAMIWEVISKIVFLKLFFWFQVISVLRVQRLMGAEVACFLSEKFLSLLRQTILLWCKRRSITGNQNREIGEELCRKKFSTTSQKNSLAKICKAHQDLRQKNKKIVFNSHANMVTKWLPG